MASSSAREQLVRKYLEQQQSDLMRNTNDEFADTLLTEGQINVHHNSLMVVQTNENELNDFKEQVKNWIKLDNELKAINAKIKMLDNEKKHRKKMMDKLSEMILKFMGSNEIDELNSKDGVIKYKRSMVKEPLTQKKMIEKLREQFKTIVDVDDRLNNVFKNREKVLKLCLKRS